jgi:hypothetical protein
MKKLLFLLLLPSLAAAKQTQTSKLVETMNDPAIYPISAYRKHEITPAFLQHKCSAPAPVHKKFVTWWKENPGAQKLINFNLPDWRKNWEDGKAFLAEQGIKNMSAYNYVFRLPTDPNYVVQIAGPVNRALNLFYYNGHSHGTWEQNYKNAEFLTSLKQVPTYQTISRCAYYLKYIEGVHLLKKRDAKVNIETQNTYLARIPNSDEKEVSDNTHVVIQQAYDEGSLAVVFDTPQAMKAISPATLEQLLDLNEHVGLWAISGNLLITKQGGIVVADFEQPKMVSTNYKYAYTDFEQPNLANPKDFYHKNKGIYAHEVVRGIEGIIYLLKLAGAQDMYTIVIDWIQKNKAFLASLDEAQYNGLKFIYKKYFNEELA